MKVLVIILALLSASVVNAGAQSGPFGIKWGSTLKELEAQGVKLEKVNSEGRFSTYTTENMPKKFSLAEKYALVFDKQYQLQKVIMISKDINGDVYGTEGKEKYSSIKEKLKKKYGAPSVELERVGMALYDEADEFYQCLVYSGCGHWFTGFESKSENISVVIELKGMGRGKGFIKLTYEGPSWSNAVDAMKSNVSKSDDDAL